ncbi:hypothetical protein Nmel_005489 [Mimus melanotis]
MEPGVEPAPELGAVLEAVEGRGGGAEAVERVLAWYNEEVTGPIPLPSAPLPRRFRRPAPPAIGSAASIVLVAPGLGSAAGPQRSPLHRYAPVPHSPCPAQSPVPSRALPGAGAVS